MLIWVIFGIIITAVAVVYHINRKKGTRWLTREKAIIFIILFLPSLLFFLNKFLTPPPTFSLFFKVLSAVLILPVEIIVFFWPALLVKSSSIFFSIALIMEVVYIYLLSCFISLVYGRFKRTRNMKGKVGPYLKLS
jgi:hypothetical protein